MDELRDKMMSRGSAMVTIGTGGDGGERGEWGGRDHTQGATKCMAEPKSEAKGVRRSKKT